MTRLLKHMTAAGALLVLAAGIGAGCGGSNRTFGSAIPETAEPADMAQLLADPASHDGQFVLLEGRVTSECPSGCWFWLQDEAGQVYVTTHASNFSIPQHVQKKARVYGRVFLQDGQPQVLALGVQLL